MGFAVLATVDARRVEIDIVGESHGGERDKLSRRVKVKSGSIGDRRRLLPAG